MSRKLHVAAWSIMGVATASLTYAIAQAQEAGGEGESKPKHTIEEVMHEAHMAPEGEKSLRDRVLAGDAKPEEQQQLLDLYISLAENKPPKGELDAWKEKTRAVVLSAAKVVVGRKEGAAELKKATVCAACHKDHKPPQEQ
jgi:hypothetical protein